MALLTAFIVTLAACSHFCHVEGNTTPETCKSTAYRSLNCLCHCHDPIRIGELGPHLGLHCSGHVADISRRDGESWSTLGLRVRKLDMSYACVAQQRQLRSLWLGRMVGAA